MAFLTVQATLLRKGYVYLIHSQTYDSFIHLLEIIDYFYRPSS